MYHGYITANYTASLQSRRARFPGPSHSTSRQASARTALDNGACQAPKTTGSEARPRSFCMCRRRSSEYQEGLRKHERGGSIGRNKVSVLSDDPRPPLGERKTWGSLMEGVPSNAARCGAIGTFAHSSSSDPRDSRTRKWSATLMKCHMHEIVQTTHGAGVLLAWVAVVGVMDGGLSAAIPVPCSEVASMAQCARSPLRGIADTDGRAGRGPEGDLRGKREVLPLEPRELRSALPVSSCSREKSSYPSPLLYKPFCETK